MRIRGVVTNFQLGRGGGRILTGETVSGESKPPTPKFRFLLGFRPLYFGNIENSKSFSNYSENFLKKKTGFLGGGIPRISNRGATSSASPPVATPMVRIVAFAASAVVNDMLKAPKGCVPSTQNR